MFDKHVIIGAGGGLIASITIAQFNEFVGASIGVATLVYMCLRVATQFVKFDHERRERKTRERHYKQKKPDNE